MRAKHLGNYIYMTKMNDKLSYDLSSTRIKGLNDKLKTHLYIVLRVKGLSRYDCGIILGIWVLIPLLYSRIFSAIMQTTAAISLQLIQSYPIVPSLYSSFKKPFHLLLESR
jgi:hypothetical protein